MHQDTNVVIPVTDVPLQYLRTPLAIMKKKTEPNILNITKRHKVYYNCNKITTSLPVSVQHGRSCLPFPGSGN